MNNSLHSIEQIVVAGQSFSLQRYPSDKTGTLRAWDAADSYLFDIVETELGMPLDRNKKVLVLHDNFGALTVPLLGSSGPNKIVSYGDSWMSQHAIKKNILLNDLPNDVSFASDLPELCSGNWKPDIIIGRVPKSKAQLSYLLSNIREWVDEGCRLYLSGMDKHLSKGQFDLLEANYGPSKFFPGFKKARVWLSLADKSLNARYSHLKPISLPDFKLTLSALPNVFCADKLDIGSRFLLDNFSRIPRKEKVADLACGSGVLGLSYLSRYPNSHLSFFDESYQAVRSTRDNLEQLGSNRDVALHVGDGLKSADDQSFELILCNPPFHQQNTINKHIANSFFKDAKRCLVDGGELWVVANRHLGYHVVLKRLFKEVETVAGNKKFVVLRACKQS